MPLYYAMLLIETMATHARHTPLLMIIFLPMPLLIRAAIRSTI